MPLYSVGSHHNFLGGSFMWTVVITSSATPSGIKTRLSEVLFQFNSHTYVGHLKPFLFKEAFVETGLREVILITKRGIEFFEVTSVPTQIQHHLEDMR